MTRVLVLNNYSLEEVWKEVQRGEKPDHHLFGLNYFQARGFEVKFIPFKNSQLLQGINNLIKQSRFPVPLGDLDQQWSTFRLMNEADLIYCPCQTQTSLLNYFRALGLIKIPIICVAHHPLNRGRLARLRAPFIKLLVNGVDAFLSLSLKITDTIKEVAHKHYISRTVYWGPDANYYSYTQIPGQGVVAAGRTGRDFHTFGVAASQAGVKAHIICLQGSIRSTQLFRRNVQVTIQPTDCYMKYPELLNIYSKARVLAIPLTAGENLSGLTSLMDALGMGKPVIMTRHPLIDLDVEALEIGKLVEPGDVDGWREAIQFFEDNENEALQMGQRARRLVEAGMDSMSFAKQVMGAFDSVLAGTNNEIGN